jgi:hypothetical protein
MLTAGAEAAVLSDAVSGRGRVEDLLDAPPAGLSALARFFTTPV